MTSKYLHTNESLNPFQNKIQADPNNNEPPRGGIRVGEVLDESAEEGGQVPQAQIFNALPDQGVGDSTPIYYQTPDGGIFEMPQATTVVNNPEMIYHFQTQPQADQAQPTAAVPEGVTLFRADPEHAEEENATRPETSGKSAPAKKERKKKGKEEEDTEKRKLEEKSRRLQRQLQQQKAELKAQTAQAREAALARQGAAAEAEDLPESYPGLGPAGPSYQPGTSMHYPPMPQAPQWAPNRAWQHGGQPMWGPMPNWQQQVPQLSGGWVWQQPPSQQPSARAATKRTIKVASADDSDDSEESEEEKESKKKKDKEKNWEKETPKQRATRYKKYEKMSESTEPDKQSVRHQVGAMYKSIIAQEKVVEHLRSLRYEDATDEQTQDNKDLLEEVLAARKELVERTNYLEVAHDYDWDAAKVYREMREANPSSIVLKAVTESKKRKAAVGGKKDTEEKKKKPEAAASAGSSSGGSWRGAPHYAAYHPPAPPSQYWQPQYSGYHAPYPPAAPYNRQANQFRQNTRPAGCFTCGEASHGFRRCPNASAAAAKAPPPPPPPQ